MGKWAREVKDRGDHIIVRPRFGAPYKVYKPRVGYCPICGNKDVLHPWEFTVCPSCLKRLHGNFEVVGVPGGPGVCDICGRPSFVTMRIRAEICSRCINRINAMRASRDYDTIERNYIQDIMRRYGIRVWTG